MKFLLSMPNDGQSNNYIINALQDMGHYVWFIDHRNNKQFCEENISKFIKYENIDIVLVLYLFPGNTYSPEFIKELKSQHPQVKYCSWIFDTTMQGKYCDQNEDFINIIKEYDYFFTVCKEQAESLRNNNVNSYFLREGVDKFVYDFTGIKQIYDISFIGQVGSPVVHTDRILLLDNISQYFTNLKIFGPLYPNSDSILKFHAKRQTYNDIEHSKIVAQSKINIGHSGWSHFDEYFSARNYRIMGSGGFLLANRSNGIEKVFEENKEIVLYNNISDCIDKIRYYLNHEDERKQIALNGKKKTLENYTFNHSLNNLIKIIGD